MTDGWPRQKAAEFPKVFTCLACLCRHAPAYTHHHRLLPAHLEADAAAALLNDAAADVGGEDDERVLEVHGAALGVCRAQGWSECGGQMSVVVRCLGGRKGNGAAGASTAAC